MYVGQAFPIGQDGETRVRGFDLAATLAPGETIVSVGSAALASVAGTDAALGLNPLARFIGTPEFSGTQIFQWVSFYDPQASLVGNVYTLAIAATTSLGQTIIPWAQLQLERGFGIPVEPSAGSPSSAEIILVPTAHDLLWQAMWLPTPAPAFVLPTQGGYALQDFPTIDPGETRLVGFDLSSALSPGETISTATFILTVLSGGDVAVNGTPGTYQIGSPIIGGGIVQQMLAWPATLPDLGGNLYALSVSASTSFNQQLLAWARINIGGLT